MLSDGIKKKERNVVLCSAEFLISGNWSLLHFGKFWAIICSYMILFLYSISPLLVELQWHHLHFLTFKILFCLSFSYTFLINCQLRRVFCFFWYAIKHSLWILNFWYCVFNSRLPIWVFELPFLLKCMHWGVSGLGTQVCPSSQRDTIVLFSSRWEYGVGIVRT